MRVSIVGYRDYGDKGRFMEIEFTPEIASLKTFLESFVAISMERKPDRPEDV